MLAGVLAGMLAGCGREASGESSLAANEKIHILYDIEGLEIPEEASVYTGDWYRADEELVERALLQYEVYGTEVHAIGKSLFTGDAAGERPWEVLVFYDEGEAFGTKSGVQGGFAYSLRILDGEDTPDYQTLVSYWPGHPDLAEQRYPYNARKDFQQFGELDFMGTEEAVRYVEGILEECGVPPMGIGNLYALDVDTLNAHAAMRQKQGLESEGGYAKGEEAYLLQFVQTVEGIPIVDHRWYTAISSEDDSSEYTQQYALVWEKGLLGLTLDGLVEVGEELERKALIGPERAEEALLERYAGEYLASDIYLEELELNYVLLARENRQKLVPAWVFCIARDVEHEDNETGGAITVKEYEHFVVNAITGEEITSSEVLSGKD